jgi:glycosyltransferase involved in cell wall biosynthesis
VSAGSFGRAVRELVRRARPARDVLLSLLPRKFREKYHRFAVRVEFETPRPVPKLFPGVNLIGYLSSASGVGESARALRLALEHAAHPCSTLDLAPDGEPGRSTPIPRAEAGVSALDVNLFCVNPEGMRALREGLGGGFFAGHRNVGYWYWEMPDLPDEWLDRFDGLDEVWVASRFVAETVRKAAPDRIEVRIVPPPVPPRVSSLSRRAVGLPENGFLFLSMADARGHLSRKNPLGSIEAFRTAFGESKEAALVLRIHHPEFDADGVAQLKESAKASNVIFLEGTFPRERISGLLSRCDAYVSLHRSEGFGFPLAEALALGKPAAATDYSGTRDYLTVETGFPIAFRTQALKRPVGPYAAGAIWAEPDVEDAARALREIYGNRTEAARRGARAAAFMEQNFSVSAAAERLSSALAELRHESSGA